jgi:hypothetical protein
VKNVNTIIQKIPKTAVFSLPEYDDGTVTWINLSRVKTACYNAKEEQITVYFDDGSIQVFAGAQAVAIAQQFDNLSSHYYQRGYGDGN